MEKFGNLYIYKHITKKIILYVNQTIHRKYNLTIGQEFESATSLSEYTNKSRKPIAEWKEKQWIY